MWVRECENGYRVVPFAAVTINGLYLEHLNTVPADADYQGDCAVLFPLAHRQDGRKEVAMNHDGDRAYRYRDVAEAVVDVATLNRLNSEYLAEQLGTKMTEAAHALQYKRKYIIVQPMFHPSDRPNGDPIAILFPEAEGVTHRDVASLHRAGRRPVIAAGFYSLSVRGPDDIHVEVHGGAESIAEDHLLEVKPSRPIDALIIKSLLTGKSLQELKANPPQVQGTR